MNTNWLHIEFNFFSLGNRHIGYLNDSDMKSFYHLLRVFLIKLYPYVRRKFFLFEPNPHCFFALEIKNKDDLKKIKREIKFVQDRYVSNLKFIKECYVEYGTSDADNKTGFLEIMDKITEFILIHDDNAISHIIHCILNSFGFPRGSESKFYKLMSKMYN